MFCFGARPIDLLFRTLLNVVQLPNAFVVQVLDLLGGAAQTSRAGTRNIARYNSSYLRLTVALLANMIVFVVDIW